MFKKIYSSGIIFDKPNLLETNNMTWMIEDTSWTFWINFEEKWFCFWVKKINSGLFFSFLFGLFKQTIQFLQQINAKNVHPVYGARIQTHNLSNMSHHS